MSLEVDKNKPNAIITDISTQTLLDIEGLLIIRNNDFFNYFKDKKDYDFKDIPLSILIHEGHLRNFCSFSNIDIPLRIIVKLSYTPFGGRTTYFTAIFKIKKWIEYLTLANESNKIEKSKKIKYYLLMRDVLIHNIKVLRDDGIGFNEVRYNLSLIYKFKEDIFIPLIILMRKKNKQIDLFNLEAFVYNGNSEFLYNKKQRTKLMNFLFKNNLICANCNSSEQEPIKFKKCNSCRLVHYCSEECQKIHWKIHKKDCCINIGAIC